jgi:hypothetical protein
MKNRRSFLSVLAACAISAIELPRAAASALTSTTKVYGVFGSDIISGTINRFCVFGRNLHEIASIVLEDPDIVVQSCIISADEVIVDVLVPTHSAPGTRRLTALFRSAQFRGIGHVRVVVANTATTPDNRAADLALADTTGPKEGSAPPPKGKATNPDGNGYKPPPRPIKKGFPCTPGFPSTPSNCSEQFYDVPPSPGIGAEQI